MRWVTEIKDDWECDAYHSIALPVPACVAAIVTAIAITTPIAIAATVSPAKGPKPRRRISIRIANVTKPLAAAKLTGAREKMTRESAQMPKAVSAGTEAGPNLVNA